MEQTSLRDQLGEALIAAAAVPHTMPVEIHGQAGTLTDAVLPVARRAAETAARTAIEQAATLFEDRGRALLDGGLTDCAEVAKLLREFAALPADTAAAVVQLGALPVPAAPSEYLYCGADLGRNEYPFTCERRIGHDGKCGPNRDTQVGEG
ncbi:hypothetical protein WB388_17950 [Streptomyces brasiliscabiei]|uniref:Uncharacterized protein n=1 Tax=Streptomyces brasiliscabiei TaxID=2736302 RepID=A0ABU8GH51_9ACTN